MTWHAEGASEKVRDGGGAEAERSERNFADGALIKVLVRVSGRLCRLL